MDVIYEGGKPRDVSKLPVWAKTYIGGLQRLVAYQKGELHRLVESEVSTDIQLQRYPCDQRTFYLPQNSLVVFKTNLDEQITVGFSSEYPGTVEVRSSGGSLAVYPRISNVISVGMGRDRY